MAQFKFTECGREVSDKASACPNCGCPIERVGVFEGDQFEEKPKKSKGWIWALMVALLCLIGGEGNSAYAKLLHGENEKEAIVELTPDFVSAIQKYEKLGSFSEGLAAVMRDGKWGYINTKGEEVIPCRYSMCEAFNEGLAAVQKYSEEGYIDTEWGYIDTEGKEVIPLDIEAEKANEFFEGLAVIIKDYKNFTVIDTKGNVVFNGKCDFEQYGEDGYLYMQLHFIQGLLCVPLAYDKFAVYDKQGNMTKEINQEAKDELDKQDGLKPYNVFAEDNGQDEDYQNYSLGLKDSNGKEIIPAIYDGINNVGLGEKTDAPNGVVLVVLDETGDDVVEGYGGEFDSPSTKRHYGYADLKGNDTFSNDIKEKCGRTKDIALLKIKEQEEELRKSYSVNQSQESVQKNMVAFNTSQDFNNYFSTPKKYAGRGPIFDGIIELKGNGVSEISVYVNGCYLSPLGLIRPDQKYLFGDHAKMYVYDGAKAYPLIIHLPDDKHPYEYIYFEPLKTSTDRNIAMLLHIPITEGWLWVEPDVQNNKGTLIWHTDEVSKPSPIIYKRIDSK